MPGRWHDGRWCRTPRKRSRRRSNRDEGPSGGRKRPFKRFEQVHRHFHAPAVRTDDVSETVLLQGLRADLVEELLGTDALAGLDGLRRLRDVCGLGGVRGLCGLLGADRLERLKRTRLVRLDNGLHVLELVGKAEKRGKKRKTYHAGTIGGALLGGTTDGDDVSALQAMNAALGTVA